MTAQGGRQEPPGPAGPGWGLRLWARREARAAGQAPDVTLTGLPKRDAALLMAARAAAGVDCALPPAEVAEVRGPRDERWTLERGR